MTDVPPPTPLPTLGEDLPNGLWAGRVSEDPALTLPRAGGRLRRWSYAAAAEGPTTLGVAIVDLGILATAFAFLRHEGDTWTWDHKAPLRRGANVAHTSVEVSTWAAGRATIKIGGDGSVRLDAPMVDGPRVRARLDAGSPGGDRPAVLRTPTSGGGWNVTEKAAGYPVRGVIEVDGEALPFGLAGGWRDWTTGRQDRRTTWRWAAGAGRGANGARVGLNVSTGMNDLEAGENVVWWGGTPHALALEVLEPAGRARDGNWRLAGPGWRLQFESCGVRAASENVGVFRSVYTQPIGTFRGTLPGPDGDEVEVELEGVTEDHIAVW